MNAYQALITLLISAVVFACGGGSTTLPLASGAPVETDDVAASSPANPVCGDVQAPPPLLPGLVTIDVSTATESKNIVAVFVAFPLYFPPFTPYLTKPNPSDWSLAFSNPAMVEFVEQETDNSMQGWIGVGWIGIRILEPGSTTITATNDRSKKTFTFEVTCVASSAGKSTTLQEIQPLFYQPAWLGNACMGLEEPIESVTGLGFGPISDSAATEMHRLVRDALCAFDGAVADGDQSALQSALATVKNRMSWFKEAERLHNAQLTRHYLGVDPRLDQGGVEQVREGQALACWGAPVILKGYDVDGTEISHERLRLLCADFVYSAGEIEMVDLYLLQ